MEKRAAIDKLMLYHGVNSPAALERKLGLSNGLVNKWLGRAGWTNKLRLLCLQAGINLAPEGPWDAPQSIKNTNPTPAPNLKDMPLDYFLRYLNIGPDEIAKIMEWDDDGRDALCNAFRQIIELGLMDKKKS